MTYVYSRQLKRTGRMPRTLELPDGGPTGTFRMPDETTLELTLESGDKVVLVLKNAQVFSELKPVTDPLASLVGSETKAETTDDDQTEPADVGKPVLEI